jgi:hypothetical protein
VAIPYSHRLIILHKGLPYGKDLQLVGQAMIQHGRRIVEFKFGASVGTNDMHYRTRKNGH